MDLNITFIIAGFIIILLLAWSGSLASDFQNLVHRIARMLFFSLLILSPILSQAQWQFAKYQSIDTLCCDDEDGDECYFTIIAGNASGLFAITPCSGVIKVDTAAYASFVRSRTFTLTFAASDPQKNVRKRVYKIQLLKNAAGIKQRPVVTYVP